MTMRDTKNRNNGHNGGRDPETAKIIAQYLKDTPADQMQETTYIPLKMVHTLSMIQALEGQYDKIQEQVIELDTWQKRQIDPKYKPSILDEDNMPDKKSHNLFIYRFRSALHQYFRGKDGLFLEKMVILADTDLQTRGSGGLDDIFKKPMREQ